MKGKPIRVLCLLAGLGLALPAWAQVSEEDELAMSYGDPTLVSIATGSAQPLRRAPAAATVITARDIAMMGATDLDTVLESVAGVHVSWRPDPLLPQYTFRGVTTLYNPQVLVLINGIPISASFTGNRGEAWGGMPLENVARIEVLRGPGSALYGADAFSGVINVVTKGPDEIRGTEYGLRVGSFHERDAYLMNSSTFGPVRAAFFLRAGHTRGYNSIVERDAQSFLDDIFQTHLSHAPGPINAQRDAIDARIELVLDAWRLRAGYVQREIGTGIGVASALDPRGRVPEKRVQFDVSYNQQNWAPGWDLSLSAGTFHIRQDPGDPKFVLFPAGAFGGAFPDGVVGDPGHFEHHNHLTGSAVYNGIDGQRLRVGAGYRLDDMYGTAEDKNFNFVVLPGIGPALIPIGPVVDARTVPDLIFLQPHKRDVRYLFVQDEVQLAKDWALTAGLRYDRYSDFGGTTNPRLALVWDASYNLVVKALHGRAFRAPTFVEQYIVHNPVTIGNPDLRPERNTTNELVFAWQPSNSVQTGLTFFHYRMKDIIITVPNPDPSTGKTFNNTGDQTGRGLEWEVSWDVSRALRFSGNVSLQKSTDEATGLDAGLTPQRRLFGRADWSFAPSWHVDGLINHVADRARQPGDSRPKVPNYTLVDLSLRREQLAGGWTVRASVHNLFDKDAREPSISATNIPFDIPLARRSYSLQLIHNL